MNETITEIVEQHAEEASFLWLLRDHAVRSPAYTLADLVALDSRVEAHLDGLRVAGTKGWRTCRDYLGLQEAGELFTASVLALESGAGDRLEAVLTSAGTDPELARGVVSAFGWLPWEPVQGAVRGLLSAADPAVRRVGIAACAAHRRDPGPPLETALRDGNAVLRARALRAVGELGRADLVDRLEEDLLAEDEGCRFSACWSAALFGDLRAVAVLQSFAGSVRFAEPASQVLFRSLSLEAAHDLRLQLHRQPRHQRLAVAAAGIIGDPSAVPWLLELLAVPELARLAGEALVWITGVDLSLPGLEGRARGGDTAGPGESLEGEEVQPDPDEGLPWPEPEGVGRWWDARRREFAPGTRYLLGRALSEANLHHTLRYGTQRQRAAAALEMAIENPGRPVFEVRAPGDRQARSLAA